MLRRMSLGLLTALPLLAAPNYFPLHPGNQWLYRETSTGQSIMITVGEPAEKSGEPYYPVKGYAAGEVWVQRGRDGSLYRYDEGTGAKVLLTSFDHWGEAPYQTDLGGCVQTAVSEWKVDVHEGPLGEHQGIWINYQPGPCRDVGLEQEFYAANVGLLSRRTVSLRGSDEWKLIYAKVQDRVFSERHLSITLAMDRALYAFAASRTEPRKLNARMTVSLHQNPPLRLEFPGPFEVEFVLRTADGTEVWRSSQDQAGLPAIREEWMEPGQRHYIVTTTLQSRDGAVLPDGLYWLEASVNTARPMSARTPLEIRTIQ